MVPDAEVLLRCNMNRTAAPTVKILQGKRCHRAKGMCAFSPRYAGRSKIGFVFLPRFQARFILSSLTLVRD